MRLIRILRIGVGTTLLLLLLSVQLVTAQTEGEIRGAWQPFTGGVMIWVESQDMIYVLTNVRYDSGHPVGVFRTYRDNFNGDAYPSPHRSGGCWNVRRGFKIVLNQHPTAKDALGCAMAPEIGYGEPNGRDIVSAPDVNGYFLIYGPGNTIYLLNPNNRRFVTYIVR
jgi:hypothetical protein